MWKDKIIVFGYGMCRVNIMFLDIWIFADMLYVGQDFDQWSMKKKVIHYDMHENNKNKRIFIKQRQIWYVSLGQNIGFEENGKGEDFKRPVLVLKILGNMYLCVALTTKGKNDSPFYLPLPSTYFDGDSYIIKSQVRVIDKARFIEKIPVCKNSYDQSTYVIDNIDFSYIQKELQTFWF